MKPFVSVVVPVYNRRDLLVRLIDSLDEVQYPRERFEVIVVDNGSGDGAWEYVIEAAARVRFTMRCLQNKDVRVPAASRNLGIREAKGEIIAFTDSDCVVTPSWIDEGVACFRDGVGIVQGRVVPYPNDPVPPAFRTVRVESKGYGETANIFYLREAVLKAGGFLREFYFYSWGEDTDLAYRVKELGYDWLFCARSVVYHRILRHTIRTWLAEPWRTITWAKTVKRHPAIRRDLLWGGWFLSRSTALFDAALLGLILSASVSPFLAALAVPYIVDKFREGGHHLPLAGRIARVAASSARSFIIFVVLVCGSIRFRCIVL